MSVRLASLAVAALLTACTPVRGSGGGGGGGNNDGGSDSGVGRLPCPTSEETGNYVDVFLLPEPGEGVFVQITVDTVSAATTFDPAVTLYGDPDLNDWIDSADDDFACTFPPPEYECPELEIEAPAGNLYIVVSVADYEQCASSEVRYDLDVRVNGAAASVELIGDDELDDDDVTDTEDPEEPM